MIKWENLIPAPERTHHIDLGGTSAYQERFDEVLKFHAPGLAPVRRGPDAWHIHANGLAAYDHRFERTFGFYEGIAAAVSREGWLHIRPLGEELYRQRYAWCGNFQGSRCTVREHDGTYRHIKPSGEPAYSEKWRYAGDFRDGIAVVQAADGRSTHIDLEGCPLHDRWFLDLDVFHKGFARARDDDGWAHVDRTGEPRYGRRFAAVEPFYNGQARVERFDGGLEVIDEEGQALLELRPATRSEFTTLSGDLAGFSRTQTIAAAVKLGVIEALPGSAKEIARSCHLMEDRAVRLLRALGELSLVTGDGSTWKLTPSGECFRVDIFREVGLRK